jgi:hypothetical protein
MIDIDAIDRMFEVGLRFGIFDKRVLIPLSLLPDAVARETGEQVSEEELRLRAGQGWFPLLPGAGEQGDDEGRFPKRVENPNVFSGRGDLTSA